MRVLACGICGSDLHFFHAGFCARPAHAGPRDGGRRRRARRRRRGPRARATRVAIEPMRSCGVCAECRAGQPRAICRELQISRHPPAAAASPSSSCVPAEPRVPRCPPISTRARRARGADGGGGARRCAAAACAPGSACSCSAPAPSACWRRSPRARSAPARCGSARAIRTRPSSPARSARRACSARRKPTPRGARTQLARELPDRPRASRPSAAAPTRCALAAARDPPGRQRLRARPLPRRRCAIDPLRAAAEGSDARLVVLLRARAGRARLRARDAAGRRPSATRSRRSLTHRVPLDEVARGFALAADRRPAPSRSASYPEPDPKPDPRSQHGLRTLREGARLLQDAARALHGRVRLSRTSAIDQEQIEALGRSAPRAAGAWRSSRAKAKALGLWNLFLPDAEYGAGLTQPRVRAALRDHGPQPDRAARLQLRRRPTPATSRSSPSSARPSRRSAGSSRCSTGEIRSCFSMTEPEVSGADPTRPAHARRPRRRRLRDQRPQVVHVGRDRRALRDRDGGDRTRTRRRTSARARSSCRPTRPASSIAARGLGDGPRGRRRPLRDPLRELPRAGREPARPRAAAAS